MSESPAKRARTEPTPDWIHTLHKALRYTKAIDTGEKGRAEPEWMPKCSAYWINRPGAPPIRCVPVILGFHRHEDVPWYFHSGHGPAGVQFISIEHGGATLQAPTAELSYELTVSLHAPVKPDTWTWLNYTPGVVLSNDKEMVEHLNTKAGEAREQFISTWLNKAVFVDSSLPSRPRSESRSQ